MYNYLMNMWRALLAKPQSPDPRPAPEPVTPWLYGDGNTIHSTQYLDVETYRGKVTAVWFRCMHLPFKQTEVSLSRAKEMQGSYADNGTPTLLAVKVTR